MVQHRKSVGLGLPIFGNTDSINKSHWNTDGIKHKTYISIKKTNTYRMMTLLVVPSLKFDTTLIVSK